MYDFMCMLFADMQSFQVADEVYAGPASPRQIPAITREVNADMKLLSDSDSDTTHYPE